ncbi:MAG: hypothetical protein A4E60_00860 [Syntrophorhabdus sp. PtaB.Bin047]|nr:MAG: hypothetical protein A4E60_00860 [Syntrophorhabdus sp. PtaB.Bin047]
MIMTFFTCLKKSAIIFFGSGHTMPSFRKEYSGKTSLAYM